MPGIPFDCSSPDIETARLIVLERLRTDAKYNQMDRSGEGFDHYVEYHGKADRRVLADLAEQVVWELVLERVLVPGEGADDYDFPWFRITAYGRQVIESGEPNPHDPTRYLEQVAQRVTQPDDTVMSYLAESLDTFRRGSLVASTVMLGVAAERVFLLLCDSLLAALADPQEQTDFSKALRRIAMKPKLDFVHAKMEALQNSNPRPAGFPESAVIALTAVYDLLRRQRNDMGHPRETPPQSDRSQAFANLQVFAVYYEVAERIREFLSQNAV
jgi:hypothetical protein